MMASPKRGNEQSKRRSAQRRLAREIRSGYRPSAIGKSYRRELERMRAPIVSKREMNVISQEGRRAGISTVYGLTKSERHEIWRHRAIVNAYLNYGVGYQPENPYTRSYYTKKRLENMMRNYEGKMTGGVNPVEFASDPDDIIALAQAEDISFETMYPHVMATAA